MIFGQWGPDGGMIHCDACWANQDNPDWNSEACRECLGEGALWVERSKRELLEDPEFSDAQTVAWLVLVDRERPWSPEEYFAHAHKWWEAFHYCFPYVMLEYDAMLDRRRREQEQAVKWQKSP